MQNIVELASRKAKIQSALKQALIQSALEDKDEANLQSILAEAEQDPDDDELNKARLMKLIAHVQSPRSNARTQWFRRAWKVAKHLIG